MDWIFILISIFMVTAAGLQAYSAAELGDNCDTKLSTASIIAATSLFGSFIFNGIWVLANRKKMSKTKMAAIAFWTAAVVVGTAAAGAALGQAELYADLSCEVEYSIGLHYASIVLLVVSIAWPHAMQKRQGANKFADAEGKPIQHLQPLRFL
jgi:hypothetical protein